MTFDPADAATDLANPERASERTQAEAALRQSEQQLRELNASKDTFFSIMAHDLRGPLNSLNELTQIAEERLASYRTDNFMPEKPGFFRKTWFLDVKENYS